MEYRILFATKTSGKICLMAHLLTHWWQQQSNSHSDRLQPQLREPRLEYTPFQYENETTGVQRSKESSKYFR